MQRGETDLDESTYDRRSCNNESCVIRNSCARQHDDDFNQPEKRFAGGEQCSAFILRRALGRDNPDMVLTEGRRRGKRHNAHAYTEPRKEYPGSEALFGARLVGALRRRSPKRGAEYSTSNLALPTRPDLMVTRHIKDGHNIKEED